MRYDLFLLFAAFVGCFGGRAFAQCSASSPPGAASPWPTCTTWAGPKWQAYPTWSKNMLGSIAPAISPIDLNGDGLTDLFYYGGHLSPTIGVATSTATSFNTNIVPPTEPAGTFCYLGNFDGSGKTGIACVISGSISYASSNSAGFGSFKTQTFTGSTLYGSNLSISGVYSPNPCFVMDVDGDGTDDLVCGSPPSFKAPPGSDPPSSTAWGVYLSSGGTFTYQVWNGPAGGYPESDFCLVGDFNGDGLKDLACSFNSSKNTWSMLLSTGTGWAVQTWTGPEPFNSAYFGTCHSNYGTANLCGPPCMVGDFDGDGVDDIACVYSSSQWSMGFGGGQNNFKNNGGTLWTGVGLPANIAALGDCITSDIFGAGRAGLVCMSSAGASSTSFAYLASSGSGFTTTMFSTSWSLNGSGGAGFQSVCLVADFNGDGIKDIACDPAANGQPGSGQWLMGLSSRPQ